MAKALNVLVVESERGAAAGAIQELEGAGHSIHRCHEIGDDVFPCNALAEARDCPFDAAPIDVAVTVRAVPRSQPTVLEDGIVCAMKRHVPVVVTGRTALHPYEGWATETAPLNDVVAAVERAAGTEMPAHQAVARAALDLALSQRGVDPSCASVRVERHLRGLRVVLALPSSLSASDHDMIAVRVMGALRAADTTAAFIDVGLA
jgi:hypothetical protein